MPCTPTRSQFLRFCLVGASGYGINLAAYTGMLEFGLHYLAAAAISFLVAGVSNFFLNRTWTFGTCGKHWFNQCWRAFLVSALSLGANQLFLYALVTAGAGHLEGQAAAIMLVTPVSFAANKLWAFATWDSPGASAAARSY
jgi:putative flippase GtrA